MPEERHEAAKVDGATAWQRLKRVTVPNMKAAIMVALLFRTLDAYRIFDTVVSVTLATLAAYSIDRLEFRGERLLLSTALAIAMFPTIALVGPLFDTWRSPGLYDTWLGLIIPYMSFTLPLSIWVLSAFFREIPWEMEGAARPQAVSALGRQRQRVAMGRAIAREADASLFDELAVRPRRQSCAARCAPRSPACRTSLR